MSVKKSESENPVKKKKKILIANEYEGIRKYIHSYRGLPIDCERELIHQHYAYVDSMTIKSIVQNEYLNRERIHHYQQQQHQQQSPNDDSKAQQYLQQYEAQASYCAGVVDNNTTKNQKKTILLKMAINAGINPVAMCRNILQTKYNTTNKKHLVRLIKFPQLIDDDLLAANVMQCLSSDSQDGPLSDLRRRILGEEYEFKLKEMSKAAGMHYYDENDLRRLGYDKTPDMKMILPFLYKGQAINWIESKATFGDVKTHKYNMHHQLKSYNNRFGNGIVIYWFGYHEDTPRLPDNSIGIIVLDDFPNADDVELFKLLDRRKSSPPEKENPK